jgi:hypothetical protein
VLAAGEGPRAPTEKALRRPGWKCGRGRAIGRARGVFAQAGEAKGQGRSSKNS